MPSKEKKRYRVVRGIAYPPGREVLPAAPDEDPVIVDDIPAKAVPSLVEMGCIEEVTD